MTQAWSYSRGYADIDLIINRTTGEIEKKSAEIVPAYADQSPGTSPDAGAAAFLAADEKIVEPEVEELIGRASSDITRDQSPAGESALGDMVADSQRAAMKADAGFSFVRFGAGRPASRNNPVGRPLCRPALSRDRALDDPVRRPDPGGLLNSSGRSRFPRITSWSLVSCTRTDPARPAGSRVTDVQVSGRPLDKKTRYMVSMVDFLASGGDGYTTFREGTNITNGPLDVDALVAVHGIAAGPG